MPNEVVYHPLPQSTDSTAPAQSTPLPQEFDRIGKMWWDKGPVNSCCMCFPLRFGMFLLSVQMVGDALLNFYRTEFIRASVELHIAEETRKAELYCSETHYTSVCEAIRERMRKDEEAMDFVVAHDPFYQFVGVILMALAITGFLATFRKSVKMTRIFMTAYPAMAVFSLVLCIFGRKFLDNSIYIKMAAQTFFLLYYFKVAWSYYVRCKWAESEQRAVDASARGVTVQLPITNVAAVV